MDAVALVRRYLWLASGDFSLSAGNSDTQEIPVALYHRMVGSLAYAAVKCGKPSFGRTLIQRLPLIRPTFGRLLTSGGWEGSWS